MVDSEFKNFGSNGANLKSGASENSVYNANQIHLGFPDGFENHFWTLARNRIVEYHLKSEIFNDGFLALDVGSGPGYFVCYCREKGINVIGCDLSQPTNERVRQLPYLHYGLAASNLPLSVRSEVTHLLFLDVLEHQANPTDFLNAHLLAFPKLEYLIITVPARRELWSAFDTYYGHQMRYSLKQLENTINSIKELQVLSIKYLFQSLYPLAILRKIRGSAAKQVSSPSAMGRGIHRLFSYFLLLEYFLCPKYIAGTSLIAKCKVHRNIRQ